MRRSCGSPRPTCRCRTTSSSSGSRSPAPTAWSPPSAASCTSTEPPAPRPVSPMPTNVYMEALSPTMEEGRVVKWHKKEGDQVTTGDTLAEVETDKAVMDLVARADGVLRQVAVAEGETVAVGKVVAIIAAPAVVPPPSRGSPAVGGAWGSVRRRPVDSDPQDDREAPGDLARPCAPLFPHDGSRHGASRRGARRAEPPARRPRQGLVQRRHPQGDRARAHQAPRLQRLVPGRSHPLLERGAPRHGGGRGGRADHADPPSRGREVPRGDQPRGARARRQGPQPSAPAR